MARTPLDIMIDRACGFDALKPLTIMMRCPHCRAQKVVQRRSIDPVRATLLCYPCPSCEPSAASAEAVYLDGQGRQVPL